MLFKYLMLVHLATGISPTQDMVFYSCTTTGAVQDFSTKHVCHVPHEYSYRVEFRCPEKFVSEWYCEQDLIKGAK